MLCTAYHRVMARPPGVSGAPPKNGSSWHYQSNANALQSTPRIQDLAVNLEGSPDAYETLIVEPPQGMEHRGILMFVGELRSAPASSRYLLSLVASTLRHAYYAPSGAKRRDHFAEALHATNKALGNEAKAGQDQWYGNVAFVAAAIVDNHLYVSVAGAGRALLIRDGLPQAIEAQAESTNAAFSAVAQGSLRRGDTVALLPASNLHYIEELGALQNTTTQSEFLKKIRSDRGGALLILYAQNTSAILDTKRTLGLKPALISPSEVLKQLAHFMPDPARIIKAAETLQPFVRPPASLSKLKLLQSLRLPDRNAPVVRAGLPSFHIPSS